MPKRILKPSSALFPAPVVLVSCGSTELPNAITIAWAGVINSTPPMVSISIRPSRYSHDLITESREFVINIPTTEQLEEVDYCGMISGREVDKFADCDFTAVPASEVSAPLIAECPINLECAVTQIISLATHSVFLAQVEAIHGEETVIDDKGRVDVTRALPLTFVTHSYYQLGDYLNEHGFTRGKLTSPRR